MSVEPCNEVVDYRLSWAELRDADLPELLEENVRGKKIKILHLYADQR